MAESKDPRQSLECGRKVDLESESRRVLLLDTQGDVPLRAIYGDRAAGSNSAYLDVAKHLGRRVDGDLTFKKKGEDTLMTLVHSGLPDHELARGHEKGWNYFLDIFPEQFGNGSRKET